MMILIFESKFLKTLVELGNDQKSLQVLKDEKNRINERVEGRLKHLHSLTSSEDREQAEDEISLLLSLHQRLKSTAPPTTSPPSKPTTTSKTSPSSNSNLSSTSTNSTPLPNGTKTKHKN